MNFQIGDYYSLPKAATNIKVSPQIAEFNENNEACLMTVGEADVSFDVGNEHADFHIKVERAKINLVLVNGQSNADGGFGAFDINNAIIPHRGCAYLWDHNRLCLIDDWKSPLPQWEANYAPDKENDLSPVCRGWFAPLADELYNLGIKHGNVEKTLIVHSCRGGAHIGQWLHLNGSEGDLIDQAVRRVRSALKFLKDNSDKYELVRIGQVWLQGEGGENEYGVTDPGSYYRAFSGMISILRERIGIEYTGIIAVRTSELIHECRALYLQASRLAQYAAAGRADDVFIVSNITENWNSPDKKYFFDGKTYTADELGINNIHYDQRAYNIIGTEAARTLYSKYHKQINADRFVLISSNGLRHYESGSEVSLSENMQLYGFGKEFSGDVSCLCPVLLPLGAAKSDFRVYVISGGERMESEEINLGIFRAENLVFPAILRCENDEVTGEFILTP